MIDFIEEIPNQETGRVKLGIRGKSVGAKDTAHATWWFGIDHFVPGSYWRPQSTIVAMSPNEFDGVDAAAWHVLVDFVTFRGYPLSSNSEQFGKNKKWLGTSFWDASRLGFGSSTIQ